MSDLPEPKEEAIFLDEEDFYACLANEPKVRGHSVLVWKEKVKDLTLLNEADYLKLMEALERVQEALEKVYETEKVYLLYMDETRHVHWHLIPRKDGIKGPELLEKDSGVLAHPEDAEKIKDEIK